MENLPKRLAISGATTIEKRLNLISGGKILDVATGNGEFIHTLIQTFKDYNSFVGIEISKKDLEIAKEQFENQPVEFLEMNAETLEFETSSFDTVCISHSLHHLDKMNKVLAEMKRVLKSDGYFIIQEMYRDGEQTEAQRTNILQHHWESEIDSLLGIPHYNTFTKQNLQDVVRNLELNEVETFEATYPVSCLFCEDRFECHPKREKAINVLIEEVNDTLSRLKERFGLQKFKEHPNLKRLQEEGEQIKERIKKFGSAPASYLFFIGKK